MVTTQTGIHFTWNPSEGNGYDLFLSRRGDAENARICCLNMSGTACTLALQPGDYEWFVRIYNEPCPRVAEEKNGVTKLAGGTESSNHRTFTILEVEAPTKLTTKDNPVTAAGTMLQWDGGVANKYDVYLEPGTECRTTTPLNSWPIFSDTPVQKTGPLKPNTTYAWRVGAWSGLCCTPQPTKFSPCATFTVACDSPPAGQIKLEPTDVFAQRVTLRWVAPYGKEYKVYVSGSPEPHDVYTLSKCLFLNPETEYTWHVEAVDDCAMKSSDTGTFKTGKCFTTSPQSTNEEPPPAGDGRVNFHWRGPDGCNWGYQYEVWYKSVNDKDYRLGCTSGTPSCWVPGLKPGSYVWHVMTKSSNPGLSDHEVCNTTSEDAKLQVLGK